MKNNVKVVMNLIHEITCFTLIYQEWLRLFASDGMWCTDICPIELDGD